MKYLSIFLILTLSSIIGILLMYNEPKAVEPIIKEVTIEKIVEPKGTIISLSIEDLYINLGQQYPHISNVHKQEIMESIALVSDKYNISPLVVYALIGVESSFRWWIIHPQVTVKSYDGKSVKTNAIGLGGIIFEIWGEKLIKANIIETKTDLFTIKGNIGAIGFVYSELKGMAIHPKASNSIESGLIRYFGGGYVSYFRKIDSVIAFLLKSKVYK